jgi:D-alanyl-D-alanine dipeptidase
MKRTLLSGLLALVSCSLFSQQPRTASLVLDRSSQLIVVTTADWNAVDGWLQQYQRLAPSDPWNAVGAPIPVVVGRKGMGWGIGVMSIEDLRGAGDPVKQEGDHKSPAGVFRLGSAFGYAPQAPSGWKMPYTALTSFIDCVDDPQSRHYNSVLDRSTVTPDWNSAEHMREAGEAYRWGVIIEHNASPVLSGAGSCVFMHVWGGTGIGTEGCTAMNEQRIESILTWLSPATNPLLVQMPVRQYSRLKTSLNLPALPSDVLRPVQQGAGLLPPQGGPITTPWPAAPERPSGIGEIDRFLNVSERQP